MGPFGKYMVFGTQFYKIWEQDFNMESKNRLPFRFVPRLPYKFSLSIKKKKVIMVVAAMDWVAAAMTLAPSDFSFPSTTTVIVKMEVDQRWIGVEGLEFGVVKMDMILELEVVGIGDVKKLQRWWWVLATIEGKLVVVTGTVADVHPMQRSHVGSASTLSFSVEKPKKQRRWRMNRRNWKDEQGNLFKFWSMLTWRLGCCCGRKIQRCQGRRNSTLVQCRRHHCSLFFWSVMETRTRRAILAQKMESA